MAVHKRKILDAARKYAQKGSKQKALREYNTLLKLDPCDAKLRLEVGDAHRRWNQNEDAIGHYHKVAEQYQQDGFDARAVAVHKQILNLDPKRYAAYFALSELYQRMGLDAEAVGALQAAADGYYREGQKREALEVLRKMAKLDPSNTTSRLKVAELLTQEGLEEDAVEEFEAVAMELVRQGEAGAAEDVYERLVELRPDRTEILLRMARNAIAMGQLERAETWAKCAVENDENEETFGVLCEVYKALERTEALVDATKRLATIYRDHGDEATARTIMQRLPGVDAIGDTSDTVDVPDGSEETEESLIGAAEDFGEDGFLGDDGTDVFELGADSGDDIGADAFGAPDELDTSAGIEFEMQIAAPERVAEKSTSEAEELPTGAPDQLFAEASVYLRYGKTEQAVAGLRAILVDEPGHRPALEKLGEALVESGDPAGAVAMWSKAAECARDEDDFVGFDVLRGRISTLDEDAAAGLGPAQPASVEAAAPSTNVEAIEIDADDALFSDGSVADVAGNVAGDEVPDEIEIEFDLDDMDDEIQLGMSAASVDGVELPADFASIADANEGADATLPADSAADELAVALAQACVFPAAEPETPETEMALDAAPAESAFESAVSEAEEAPVESVDESLDEPIAESEAFAAVAVDEHEDGSFDLAAEISGAFVDAEKASSSDGSLRGTEEEAFANLFDDFKRGVTEMLDEGDYETRYDLAIAYKEMGLVEDAIAAFQVCVSCPTRGLDSLQLMAQCQLEAGRVSDAIGHLEQALSTDGLSPERRAGIYFDLGRAFTVSGDTARARSNFETVTELDPSFPGVVDAVTDLLAQMESPAAGEPVDADADDAFESFDDLIAEATAEAAVCSVVSGVAADERSESFVDGIEEAHEGTDGAEGIGIADVELERVEVEPQGGAVGSVAEPALEQEPERPKPKKARKKISFV